MEIRGREPTDPGDLVHIKDDSSGVGGQQLGQGDGQEGAHTAVGEDWQHRHGHCHQHSPKFGIFLVSQDVLLLHYC